MKGIKKEKDVEILYTKVCYNDPAIYSELSISEKDELKNFALQVILRNKEGMARHEESAFNTIRSLSAKVKHHGFKEENEYRLLIFPQSIEGRKLIEENSENLKPILTAVVDPRDQNKPYVELPILQECVLEVVIGPGENIEQRERELRLWLDYNGYVGVNVSKSDIPFIPSK